MGDLSDLHTSRSVSSCLIVSVGKVSYRLVDYYVTSWDEEARVVVLYST